MRDLWPESRQALRSLLRSPRASAACLLTLALGTGASLAIFGVVRATLLSPLPFREPSRLMGLSWEAAGGKIQPFSPADVTDLRQSLRSFKGLGAYHVWTFNLGGTDTPERREPPGPCGPRPAFTRGAGLGRGGRAARAFAAPDHGGLTLDQRIDQLVDVLSFLCWQLGL